MHKLMSLLVALGLVLGLSAAPSFAQDDKKDDGEKKMKKKKKKKSDDSTEKK